MLAETLLPYSWDWKSSGMGGPTGWSTAQTSDRPSDASESSLSAIVEATPDPHGKFWLTAQQARGLMAYVRNRLTANDPDFVRALEKASASGGAEPTPEAPPPQAHTTPTS